MVKTLKTLANSMLNDVISSLEIGISEEDIMKKVICPVCGGICIKYGKNKSGSQRWFCNACSSITTPKIDNNAKWLKIFLKWLFSKSIQKEMPGGGRSFRRNTAKFWDIWPMPPKIEEAGDVVFVDGIYIAKKLAFLYVVIRKMC